MAERRKSRKKKDDSDVADKPTKEEYAVAKFLRFECPVKKTNLYGNKVECFMAAKAIDCLLDSKWATNKGDTRALFTDRQSVVRYLDGLLSRQVFFHRALKIVKPATAKKERKEKKKEDAEKKKPKKDEESESTADEASKAKKSDEKETKKKEKRKIRLEMHDHQVFLDGSEVYVWIYDPVSTKTFIYGLLVVLGTVAACMYPLWPPELRTGIYYLSMAGCGAVGALLVLIVLRGILYGIIYCATFGRLCFWIFPNLTEDVGFIDSFKPLYEYEYKSHQPEKSSADDSSKKPDEDGKDSGPGEVADSDVHTDTDRQSDYSHSEADQNSGSVENPNSGQPQEGSGRDNGFELIEQKEIDEAVEDDDEEVDEEEEAKDSEESGKEVIQS